MLGEGAIIDKGNNLDENTQALEDVAAAGAADPVKRKVDRIVFDAQTIAADNLNLYDILLATPSVVATEEDISIAGKGRALVLIDDKESRLSGKELITTLKSYNSKDIDKIEVITTPPLKYDVEGSAGVINIRLKRRVGEYLGGSIYDAESLSKYNLNEYSAVLNCKKGKVLANFTLAHQPHREHPRASEIQQKRRSSFDNRLTFSDSDRIQTCNRLIRSQVLYSVELRSHLLIASANIRHFFFLCKSFSTFFQTIFSPRAKLTDLHTILHRC